MALHFTLIAPQGDGKDKPNDPIIDKSEPIELDIKSEPPVEKHELKWYNRRK